MNQLSSQQHLIRLLQGAYSGELAAAYAYRGHWKSLRNPTEKARVHQIENEEWTHREGVGIILRSLKADPLKLRELIMWTTGRTIGLLCHLTGWFLPMYFAGRLESSNVAEYQAAASHARKLGLTKFEGELNKMAMVEMEHEMFFLNTVSNHRLLPLMQRFFGWGEKSK